MRLIILYGPPAVGKFTVGKALAKQTGYPLLHNHIIVDALMPFFPFGTSAFRRAARGLRDIIVREALRAGSPGLIMTFVWWLNDVKDHSFVRESVAPVRRAGGSVYFVELSCERATLLRRVRHASRRRYQKLSSRRALTALLGRHIMNSDRPDQRPRGTLLIDTDRLTPLAAARRIARHFRLGRA